MEETLVQALRADPTDPIAWHALADSLEEAGQTERAEYLRLRNRLMGAARLAGRSTLESRLHKLLVAGTPPVAIHWVVRLGDGAKVKLPLALVPPGEFVMGSRPTELRRYNNEGPRHLVRITRPFWLGVTPVTQGQFRALTGRSVSHFAGDDRPADSIDWPTAMEFCQRLGARLSLACRLPSEAEWEYACRAGTTTPYYTGRGTRAMRLAGWSSYDGHTGSAGETRPVGEFLPNALGLYDMHGNVREWCQDDVRAYTRRAQVDPRGRESSRTRAVRGGSWYYGSEDSRSASRYERPVDYRLNYYGFRVLVEVG